MVITLLRSIHQIFYKKCIACLDTIKPIRRRGAKGQCDGEIPEEVGILKTEEA